MRDLLTKTTLVRGLTLLLLPLVMLACSLPHQYTALLFETPQPAPDIVGTDITGAPFRLSDHKGKVVLIFFGYTYCPDICPMTLAALARAYTQVAESDPALIDGLEVAFVSFDPQRDTPERLAAYVPAFHPDFHGVYVAPAELETLKAPYGLFAEKSTAPAGENGYLMDHTSGIYLMDRAGNWAGLFKADTPVDVLADDLRHFLHRS